MNQEPNWLTFKESPAKHAHVLWFFHQLLKGHTVFQFVSQIINKHIEPDHLYGLFEVSLLVF